MHENALVVAASGIGCVGFVHEREARVKHTATKVVITCGHSHAATHSV